MMAHAQHVDPLVRTSVSQTADLKKVADSNFSSLRTCLLFGAGEVTQLPVVAGDGGRRAGAVA